MWSFGENIRVAYDEEKCNMIKEVLRVEERVIENNMGGENLMHFNVRGLELRCEGIQMMV